jgi:hypothetical protein
MPQPSPCGAGYRDLVGRSGVFGVDAAGEVMLPGPEARLAPTTFDAWLARSAMVTA